MNNVLPKLW